MEDKEARNDSQETETKAQLKQWMVVVAGDDGGRMSIYNEPHKSQWIISRNSSSSSFVEDEDDEDDLQLVAKSSKESIEWLPVAPV